MNNNEDLNQYIEAYAKNFKFSDENHMMLEWYVSRITDKVKNHHNINILSLGIGHQRVCSAIIDQIEETIGKYIIVEGSMEIINQFKQSRKTSKKTEIIHSYFENFETTIKFNFIEMGFILEHVDDPIFILNRYKKFLKESGSIFIAVPNAGSLHRLIGHKAGLLKDIFQLSPYDIALGHKRYFDNNKLEELIADCGLKVKKTEGIYLKPMTTSQIDSLNLDDSVKKAMLELGVNFPEICNAILTEVGL